MSRNEEAGEAFSWAQGEFHVPASQNPTTKMIESSSRSTRSNHRKNIYTLRAPSISRKSSQEEAPWTPGRSGTPGTAQGFPIPQSQPGSSLTTQGNSRKDLTCSEDCLDPNSNPRESSTTTAHGMYLNKERSLQPN